MNWKTLRGKEIKNGGNFGYRLPSLPLIHSIPIELYKNKEPNHHPNIHCKMDKEDPSDTIAINPTEIIFLLF